MKSVKLRTKPLASLAGALLCVLVPALEARSETVPFDSGRWEIRAKESKVTNHLGRSSLYLKGGVAAVKDSKFTNGVIEFDALGQSGPRGSNFLGVAFRVVDAQTHDAVYFRPFNFRAEEAERKAHAVQYISHPKYSWQVLRQEKPGQYEKPIDPAPDGDAWFHVRIVVEKPRVSVYVNNGKEPSLVVEELSDRKGGGVGLWVGPGQGGYIANLKITPAS
ncbi:MAG TPA: hypothetical protein VD861_06425 [Pyrinomonadaceae bacterium]|nr:hypothetical protein [Pyrinomonadaceae bacterium]